jgi:CheY-like chemotaxis protein
MPDPTTLLLVDDDETTRELLQLLLEAEGWTVTTAADGESAVSALASFAPEVILSDLQMPGLSGPNLARSLRAACRVSLRVIAMTATPQANTPDGFDALLVKPFPPSALRTVCTDLQAFGTTPDANTNSSSAQKAQTISSEVLERLKRQMPAERLRAFFEFALDDAEGRVARIRDAAGAADDARIRSEAHALKGSCGMIGAVHLRDLAAAVEQEGSPDAAQIASASFQDFDSAIADIRHMLVGLLPEKR